MIPELTLAIILFGALYGVVSVLYIAPKGYLGHPRKRRFNDSTAQLEPHAAPSEQVAGAPTAVATTTAVPVPSPVEAIYETVQPAPSPAQYAATFQYAASFGTPPFSKKPTRAYRRRSASVRGTATSKMSLKHKTKKR
jgi:hypothetical protein